MIGLGTRSENWERDWLLTYVLGDILGDRPHRSVIEAATNESMTLLVQGGIYVLSFWGGANAHAPPSRRIGASHPVALLSSALEACDARAMLVHISDECGLGMPYRGWDLVVRNYWSPTVQQMNGDACLVTVPLGYHTGLYGARHSARSEDDPLLLPPSQRNAAWAFVGNLDKDTRRHIKAAMIPLRATNATLHNSLGGVGISPSAMRSVLESAVFCPAPVSIASRALC